MTSKLRMPQPTAPVAQAERTVGVLHDIDHRASPRRVWLTGLDLQHLAI